MLRKVLLLGGVSLCAAVTVHDVPHVQHNGDIHGFSVSHVWAVSGGEVVSFKLGAAKRSAKAQEYEAFYADQSSAARTRTLAKLSLIVGYMHETGVHSTGYGSDNMAEVTANGDLYFDNASYDADVAEMQRLTKEIFDSRLINGVDPVQQVDTAALNYGQIVAFTFTSTNRISVLVFKGSDSTIDNVDVSSMAIPYLASGLGQKRWIDAWRNDAGLAWTSRQEFNSQRNAAAERELMKVEGKRVTLGLFSSMGLSTIAPSGFAPVCAQIASTWYQQAAAASYSAVITGHSLGGARAASASMKLREAGIVVPAVTFGSVGSACWTRSNYFGFSLLNSSKEDQPQLTEYVHPLDTWGNTLGRDVGRRCFWGKRNIADSRAKQYCEPISALDMAYLNRIETAPTLQGFVAAQRQLYTNLLAAGQVEQGTALKLAVEGLVSILPGFMKALNETEQTHRRQHFQCRYFTHSSAVTHEELLKELNVDGSTQSGCETLKAVEWGNEQCPWNYAVAAEGDDDFWTGKPGGPAFIVFMVVTLIGLVWGVARCAGEELDDDDASEEFNDWQAERDQEVRAEIEAEEVKSEVVATDEA